MGYLRYYQEINAQKQIDKLASKYKNKKVVLYGAGVMTRILFENFDFSKLNIVAVCDAKYSVGSDELFFSLPVINPSELSEFDFDIIFTNLKTYKIVTESIKYQLLINTKNEDKPVERLLSSTLWFYIKQLIF